MDMLTAVQDNYHDSLEHTFVLRAGWYHMGRSIGLMIVTGSECFGPGIGA